MHAVRADALPLSAKTGLDSGVVCVAVHSPADARLIAKAPEMLSLLKDMVTGYGHLMGCERVYCSPLCRQTRALLREIEGEKT